MAKALISQKRVSPRRHWLKLTTSLLSLMVISQWTPGLAASSQPANFNLQSTVHSVAATLSAGQNATIHVGSRTQVIQPGQLLTPAEELALQQVLASGHQSLILSSHGAAIGGLYDLSAATTSSLQQLVIPHGVTFLVDFSNAAAINIAGNLSNSGSIYGLATVAQTGFDTISATNIHNLNGGLISTALPQPLISQTQAVGAINLSLNAAQTLTNNGIIQGANSLGLTAHTITNTGAIIALNGDINVQSASSAGIKILSTGSFQAPGGNINITIPATSLQSGIALVGGNYLSQQLNIDAGCGFVTGDGKTISGLVNITAGSSNFGASTPNLRLGTLNVTGDPTYYNTNGPVTLTTGLPATGGSNLAVIASGDIIIDQTDQLGGAIDTTNTRNSSGGDGGTITLIAGANVTACSGCLTKNNGDNGATLSITQSSLSTHGSSTGGAIQITNVTSINSNGMLTKDGTGGNGGNILMVAFSGSGQGSLYVPGTISITPPSGGTCSINTYGGGTGPIGHGTTNGNVTIIAGATSDPGSGAAITVPAIFSGWSPIYSQSGVSGGAVALRTATPDISGTISVTGGTITGASNITFGTLQPTSISIGGFGGSSAITVSNSVSQWQTDLANFALTYINQNDRTASVCACGSTPGPLSWDKNLALSATDFAEYLAQTQRFNHYTLNSAAPWDRGVAAGFNLGTNKYAENFAVEWGGGVTPQSAFTDTNTSMINEPTGQPNHRFNLSNPANQYVGIGFATVGNAVYIVEDFSNVTGSAAVASPSAIRGGVNGPIGFSVPGSNPDTASAVPGPTLIAGLAKGSNGYSASLPASSFLSTSINTGGANIAINAGNNITATGLLLANGMAPDYGTGPSAAPSGGNVTVSAGNSVTLPGIQANGALGSITIGNASGGAGGNGGSISVSAQNGSINIVSPAICQPCLSITAAGGSGGPALDANSNGGAGGKGGSVTLTALNSTSGMITVDGISVDGGGGSGGGGGTTGGTGGAGGAGGSINISASKTVTVNYYVSASGGGGGGAGGRSSNGDGGGGGGGGSLAMGGYGGTAGVDTSGISTWNGQGMAGGGGGTASTVNGMGGASQGDNLSPTSTAGVDGSYFDGTVTTDLGNGGTAGTIGNGGTGGGAPSGNTGTTGASGGAGGNTGQAGSGSGPVAGGAAGNGGSITLQAGTLMVNKTLNDFYGVTGASALNHGGDSVLAIGTNGSVTITTTAASSALVYSDLNLATSTNTTTLSLGAIFTVGATSPTNGTSGGVEAGTAANSININGTDFGSPVSQLNAGGSSNAVVKINVGGTVTPFQSGSTVTPAELIALSEVAAGLPQTLILAADGTATGGSFAIRASNVPSGGTFGTINIPVGVTANDGVASLTVTGLTGTPTINGTLNVSTGGTSVLNAPTLSMGATGLIKDITGNLVINITGNPGNASLANVTTNALTINGDNTGALTITNIINAGQINISGFVGTSPAAVALGPNAQLNGTLISISTPSVSLGAGSSINATSINVSAPSGTGLTISGPAAGTATFNARTTILSLAPDSTGTNLTLSNNLNFAGNLVLSAPAVDGSQNIVVSTSNTIAASGNLQIFCSGTVNGAISAPSETLIAPNTGAGTIINSGGDVVLPSKLTFIGANLTIVASGNIVAPSALTSINLSNTKGDGGTLTLIAGANLTVLSAGKVVTPPAGQSGQDFSTLYTVSGPSSTGGSIFLPRVSISTSTTLAGHHAGDVLAVANAGSASGGDIFLWNITASAPTTNRSSTAGSVQLFAPGGISVGTINARGANGGLVSLSAATPIYSSAVVLSGSLAGQPFVAGTPASGSNSAVYVNGSINTSGLLGSGGSVMVLADGRLSISGLVNTTGFASSNSALAAGGSVDLESSSGFVSVGTGGINASGINIGSTLSTATGGAAGNITVNSASGITINGPLLANGANSVGSGGGGRGGNIGLSTGVSPDDASVRFGDIRVSGYLSAKGGNASKLGGNGGAGGSISTNSGQLQILGNLSGVSINGAAGTGGSRGNPGSVTMTTYSVQTLPTNFDMLSTAKSIVALPGGLLTVGIAAPVNGIAGSIAGYTTLNKKGTNGNGLIFQNSNVSEADQTTGASIAITVIGGNTSIGFGTAINVATSTGVRTLVTPTEAMALFQVTRNDTPTIVLGTNNQAGNGSSIRFNAEEMTGPFTAFRLPAGMSISISGKNPIVGLPANSLLAGNLTFTTTPGGTDYIDFGAGNMNLSLSSGASSAGSISAVGNTLVLAGTGTLWTNAGTITANTLVLGRPTTSTLTLRNINTGLTAGDIVANDILVSHSVDTALRFNFQALTAGFTTQVMFQDVPVSVAELSLAKALSSDYMAKPVVNLTFALLDNNQHPIVANVGGIISASTVNIGAGSVIVSGVLYPTRLNLQDNTTITSTGNMLLSGSGDVQIGNLVNLTAGVLKAPVSGAFASSNIASPGGISIVSSQNINFSADDRFTSDGGNIFIAAGLTGGSLGLGERNVFTANGGNIQALSRLTVNSNTAFDGYNDGFIAFAVGTQTAFRGGGIEFGSGLTSSTYLTSAFSAKSGTFQTGTKLIFGPFTTGAVLLHTTGTGTVTLTNDTNPPTYNWNLAGGVVVFDALGNGSQVNFTDSFFETVAWKPVANAQAVENADFLVDTGQDADGI